MLSLLCIFALMAFYAVASSASKRLLRILGTENETVENVQAIFQEHKNFDLNLRKVISKCKNLEVLSLIYSAVFQRHGPSFAQSELGRIICYIYSTFDGNISEASMAHKLMNLCIQQLSISGVNYSWFEQVFEHVTTALLLQGNFTLLDGFFALGCAVPRITSNDIIESATKPFEALKLCASKAHPDKKQNYAKELFKMNEFTSEEFETMIEDGSLNQNVFMGQIMKFGRLDLAYTGYMNGLFIAGVHGMNLYAEKHREIAMYIAMKESFKNTKVLLESLDDPHSKLHYVPRDVLMNQIGLLMNNLLFENIMIDMIIPEIDQVEEVSGTDHDSAESYSWYKIHK